jgi:peptidoglycan/LPS O-acetylase OafA/YrhL
MGRSPDDVVTEGTKYRREIDGLRTLAVAPVVLYHAGFPLFGGGFVGVDVFFVISGYLITGVIRSEMVRGDFSIVGFYERRIRRIMPALFLVMFACLPFAWVWLFPGELVDFARSIVAVCLFGANIFFYREIDYFSPNVDLWPLIHTWSLSVEEQFYVVLPVILLLSRRWPVRYVLLLIAGLSALSLGLAQWASRSDPQSDFYLLPTRAWELGIGSLISLLPLNRLKIPPVARSALAGLGLAMLAFSIMFFHRGMPLPDIRSLAPVGGAALIVAFARADNLWGRCLGWTPLVGVGLISYSAYLWHQPVFAFARLRFEIPSGGAAMVALSVASFGLAFASWRFVEQPFRSKKRFSRGVIFSLAFLVAALLIVISRIVAIERGFPARMPEIAGKADVGAYLGKCVDLADLSPDVLAGRQSCHLGTPGAKPDFLLVGDSHAGSLADGMNVAALREGRSGLIIGAFSCLPVVGVGAQYVPSNDFCQNLHDRMFDVVDRLGIKLVIIHARWEEMDERLPFSEPNLNAQSIRDRLHDLLLATLKGFASRGVKVKIITSTPRAPYSVPDILARKAYFGLDVEERPSYNKFLRENRTAFSLFGEPDVRKYAEFLDLYPFFCEERTDGHCVVADGSRPYFFDDSHLSLFGSLALAPRLQDVFK